MQRSPYVDKVTARLKYAYLKAKDFQESQGLRHGNYTAGISMKRSIIASFNSMNIVHGALASELMEDHDLTSTRQKFQVEGELRLQEISLLCWKVFAQRRDDDQRLKCKGHRHNEPLTTVSCEPAEPAELHLFVFITSSIQFAVAT